MSFAEIGKLIAHVDIGNPCVFSDKESSLVDPGFFTASLIDPEQVWLHVHIGIKHLWLEPTMGIY